MPILLPYPRPVRGYTLIELLVVLVVMAVLATAALPLAELTIRRERERALRQALWQIREAIDSYKRAADSGLITKPAGTTGYPPTLQALVHGVPNEKVVGQRLYFLRRVPRDPFAPADQLPEQTWGLRAYLTPPDHPAPGDDVYDVYSRAGELGLNGVPLREW